MGRLSIEKGDFYDPQEKSGEDGQETAPFSITPKQKFSSPPPRYNEGSLVKKLEEEGIGRPSTYASIIRVVQDRGYVEQVDRRFHATAMGEVVTDMLVEAFPVLMQVSYTKDLEERLDLIESDHRDWREMLGDFYGRFSSSLAHAHENLFPFSHVVYHFNCTQGSVS